MDRNTITGLILIFAIFIGFSIYNNSRINKAYEESFKKAESYFEKGNLEDARNEFINALRLKPTDTEAMARVNDINLRLGITDNIEKKDTSGYQSVSDQAAPGIAPAQSVPDYSQFGIFAGAAKGENDFITLENNKIELKIALKGGKVYSVRLKDYVTHDSRPLILFSGDSTVFGFNFFTSDNKPVQTNNLYFTPVSDNRRILVTSQPMSVSLRLMATDNKYIEYTYTLAPEKYIVDFKVGFESMEGLIASNQNSLTLDWRMYIPQQEKGRQNEENYTTLRYKYYQDDVDGFRQGSTKDEEKADVTTKLSWVAFKNQFFSSVIITDDFFLNGSMTSTRTLTSDKYLKYFTSDLGVPYNHVKAEPIAQRM
jgi:YidC/Oxa1 family membrane protein insertase